MLEWTVYIAAAYFTGSVPFGLLIGKLRGVDLRAEGSGNIGATNTGRVLGRRWGALCFVLDVGKGAAPTLTAGVLTGTLGAPALGALEETLWIGVAFAAIAGHVFPVWLGFRGGKGVATSLGALLALWPILALPAIGALVVWVVAVRLTRLVGVASSAAAAMLPVLTLAVSRTPVWGERAVAPAVVASGLLALLVLWRHRGNLRRTLAGTEPRVGASDKPAGD